MLFHSVQAPLTALDCLIDWDERTVSILLIQRTSISRGHLVKVVVACIGKRVDTHDEIFVLPYEMDVKLTDLASWAE